ncbi:MAG: hypothetical protein FWD71_16335 [Oscillospiraceae bacterium]|nr:hypothetical protein [Oscillospiraceae bacterium]
MEKVIDTIVFKGAAFEVIEKPETIYAGKAIYANSLNDTEEDISERLDHKQKEDLSQVIDRVMPERDIHISINYWRIGEALHGLIFARETTTENQPEGVDVFKMPASLFIRAYTDNNTVRLMCKETCETWELFGLIRGVMNKYNFKMATNGAQEIEIYDSNDHKIGFAYVPVEKII